MTTRQPLTLQQHDELGDELKAASAAIQKVLSILSTATPKSDYALKKMWRVRDDISAVRGRLEVRMFSEHGDDAPDDFTTYF